MLGCALDAPASRPIAPPPTDHGSFTLLMSFTLHEQVITTSKWSFAAKALTLSTLKLTLSDDTGSFLATSNDSYAEMHNATSGVRHALTSIMQTQPTDSKCVIRDASFLVRHRLFGLFRQLQITGFRHKQYKQVEWLPPAHFSCR